MDTSAIRLRSRLMKNIREFFSGEGYLEVETPLLSPCLIPESTIEPFETSLVEFNGHEHPAFLVPSPEVWMKRLIGDGIGDIFQLCRCFRNRETDGSGHNPEFTMLEWYTIGATYIESLATTEELFRTLVTDQSPESMRPPFIRMTVNECFVEYAGFPLEASNGSAVDRATLVQKGREAGVDVSDDDTWVQAFNRIFLSIVEPALPTEHPVALLNYPQKIPTLAAGLEDTPWSQRWELYVQGVELANCYTEETDREHVRRYFDSETGNSIIERRTDPSYPDLFHSGYPRCSGVALGVDRFLALLSGISDIRGVILFPHSDTVWVP